MVAPCRRLLARAASPLMAGLVAASAAATIASRVAQAVVKPQEEAADDSAAFPRPAIVRKQLRFWSKIFYRYPSTTVIVHETDDPDRIVDVIDYKSAVAGTGDHVVPRKERDEVTKRYLKRYVKAVDRFVKEGAAAVRHGAIEQRLFDVYGKSPASLQRLLNGDLKLRAQTGLADDFLAAATAAQTYLPYMESIFRQYGVPVRLTRLPFVESMFNLRARSKVGASGIWQFMPETARNFIFVNGLIDERNSPFKATRAAAQFLLTNFRELGAWPLAVTAYNHGVVGMGRAVRQVQSTDIGAIINTYESPSFGFASRNFYSEFLAAADTYDRLVHQGRIKPGTALPASTPIILQHPVSIAQIMRHTALTRDVLGDLNPCLLEAAFTTGSNKPLPAFYELRVPADTAPAVKTALQTIKTKRFASSQ